MYFLKLQELRYKAMKFLVEIKNIEAMKDEICNANNEEYRDKISCQDYKEFVESCLNMFGLEAVASIFKSKL